MRMPTSFQTVLALLSLAGAPAALRAQSATPIGRVGVTVVLTDHYAYGDAAGVIVRHAGKGAADVIVLPAATATPEDLASAALTAEMLMERDGDQSASEGMFRVTRLASVSPRESATAAKVLSTIAGSTPHKVPGLGITRAGIVYIPNAATRRHQQALGRWSVSRQP